MDIVIEKPHWTQRVLPWVSGFDLWLLLAFAMLATLGMVTMYSVGYDFGSRFTDHGRNLVVALGVMFVFAQVPPHRLQMAAVPLYALGVVLLLGVALFGLSRNGSQRWLNLGVVVQPSELLKIAMPLMLAWWFQRREGQMRALDFAVAFGLLAVPVALILKQPDLGTALLVLASGLFVMYFAGLPWKWILPPLLIAVIAIGVLVSMGSQWCVEGVDWVVLRDYQKQRVCTLLDPFQDPLGRGFHIIQGMIAIGAGGVWGKGFMQGTQTHLEFIPERTTDFIFAAFSEEFGLVGVLTLLGIFAFLIGRGLYIALNAPTLFSRVLAGAMAMNFFVYAFVNMGMVSGILPVVGVPLPFVSYGGTAMATLGLGLGILMSVSRSDRLIKS
jgi:rod shape determining protein RodA